eukprot:6195307-Pleurochrysis_carterae.AAC.3
MAKRPRKLCDRAHGLRSKAGRETCALGNVIHEWRDLCVRMRRKNRPFVTHIFAPNAKLNIQTSFMNDACTDAKDLHQCTHLRLRERYYPISLAAEEQHRLRH